MKKHNAGITTWYSLKLVDSRTSTDLKLSWSAVIFAGPNTSDANFKLEYQTKFLTLSITPKSYQLQNSPAASLEISHHKMKNLAFLHLLG